MAVTRPEPRVARTRNPPMREEPRIIGPVPHRPQQNHPLDALPASEYARIVTNLELVPMRLGDVLYEPGVRLRYVYLQGLAIQPRQVSADRVVTG